MRARSLAVVGLALVLAAGCGGEDTDDGQANEATRSARLAEAPADEVLSRDPYMGVACRTANSFACDRVGLAVWLHDPAVLVDAAIAGREVELDDPDWSGPVEDGPRRMFAGFLQPAGLIEGPLRLTPDDGPDRWIGREPVSAMVTLRIFRSDGTSVTTQLEVGLSAGWG
jgi:hypothetical protein